MTTPSTTGLRALFTGGSATGLTDGQLLERFQHRHESAEAAFEALVDRHAAMVWGVCRRSLDRADAEDAFQATFLVLVRKAGAIRPDDRGSVGRWLYGVARRVAGRLRQEAARRPPSLDPVLAEDPASLAERRDIREAVAAELDRLPSKYRRPIELCDFEGLTYEQAGVFLGWPTATLKNRLAQGRSRLRDRLTRRGLAPAAAVATAAIARECQAGVPRALIQSTCRAGAIASGTIPAAVARLTEGAIRTMFLDRMKTIALIVSTGFGAVAVAGVASPRGEETAPPSTVVVVPDAGKVPRTPDPRFSKRMQNGALVEIVAVSSAPATGLWWRPDGTPLAEPPCDSMGPDEDAEDGRYRILYQVTDAPENDDVKPNSGPASDVMGYNRHVRLNGKVVPGLRRFGLGYRTKRDTASVRIGGAYGPWETIDEMSPSQGAGHADNWPRGHRRIFSITPVGEGWTVATVVHEIDLRDKVFRLIAVDEQGKETRGTVQDLDTEVFAMYQATFNLSKDKIQGFRFQMRPRGYVTIDGIALKPNRPAAPR
ncbi:RNA polymerase sigma factor [Paludisphaera rhizosphaerae]|uniref:RNA polymerase sigma factor n=1 Tax=Paludisphaera rhizosphaerae TaxID=2711216 RepID=UPI0013EAE6E7|nr:RNA polymerase sigma factor [Paludisphaera rhizosphaerae]